MKRMKRNASPMHVVSMVLFEEDKLNKWADLEIFMRNEEDKDDKLGQQASEKQKEIMILW